LKFIQEKQAQYKQEDKAAAKIDPKRKSTRPANYIKALTKVIIIISLHYTIINSPSTSPCETSI